MRRFIRAAGLAPLTFVLGVVITLAWWQLFPRRVSLCTLAANPAAYNGKPVTVEALGSVISSPRFDETYIIIVEPGCNEPNAWATIHLNPDLEHHRGVDDFVNSRTPEIREAKLVVEGLFDQWASPGCFSPQFAIRNATVTVVSPIVSKPLPRMSTPGD